MSGSVDGPRSAPPSPIRTLIADDDPEMRSVLVDIIDRSDALELVGVAEDAQQAIELAGQQRPDAALLDVKMPGGGARAAREIRASSPQTAIIALSAHEDARSVQEMLAAGAYNYLVKGTSPQALVEAIRSSVDGQVRLAAQAASHVVSELTSRLQHEREADQRRALWEEQIRGVLAGGGPESVFQPIVALETGEVVGFEALARFESEPPRSPGAWFAEATTLGWALDLEIAAVEAAISSVDRLPPSAFVAFNVSPASIVASRLQETVARVPLARVVVEITEHAPIADYPTLRSVLATLRANGARLAVDDVGAGHASLRHILQLDPDLIKLDVSLTREIERQPKQQALARALVTFAREVGATAIAVGIETAAEMAVMRDLGVPLGQGYYLGRPGRVEDFDAAVDVARHDVVGT
jgi:EAL domain-containing protein (putative c-di-GMP-specific phosphodiesterase class I)/AmiR/NasT family two-component response regulator